MQACPIKHPNASRSISCPLTLLLLRLLQDLLDNLLLLNQESADDTIPDTVGTSRSSVGALNGLLGAGDLGVFAGSESWDLLEDCVSYLKSGDDLPATTDLPHESKPPQALVKPHEIQSCYTANIVEIGEAVCPSSTGDPIVTPTPIVQLRVGAFGFTYTWQFGSAVSTLGRL